MTDKNSFQVSKRKIIKSAGLTATNLGVLAGTTTSGSAVEPEDIPGGGGYPISQQNSNGASKYVSAVRIAQEIGVNISYYGTFEDNNNRNDGTPYFHDFNISGHGGARRKKGEWEDDDSLFYQKVGIENHNSSSFYRPVTSSGGYLGVAPDPGGSDADYETAAKTAMNLVLSEVSNYYSYANYAADIISAFVNPGNQPEGGNTASVKWEHGSSVVSGVPDTSNFMRILVSDATKKGAVTISQEVNGTDATNQDSLTTQLRCDVDNGGVIVNQLNTQRTLQGMSSHAANNEEVFQTEEDHPAFRIPRENFSANSPLRDIADDDGYVKKVVYPVSFTPKE
ncbi:hypothetical protein [Haladaptatus sp. DYF46]|uniref:hypothetical protein n=1 Tax=Haladaptatus sp. DYF46 TaxID=2886041 RepID=UPI001E561BAF|nr:hypothetical protein [Haladaptatus sp. DYF46]